MNAKAYSRSTGRLRRGLYSCVLSAVLLLGLSAWAQPEPLPILTYQRPASQPAQYTVGPNCSGQTTMAYQYSMPSGSPVWSSEDTVIWRSFDASQDPFNRPGLGYNPPPLSPQQRWSYDFYLDERLCAVWDQPCDRIHGVPRIEFDSAPDCYGPNNINIQVTCENPLSHADWTWENVGIITENTPEKIFIWSVWLPQDPAPQTQPPPPNAWATLTQWHFGGPGSDPPGFCNWLNPACSGGGAVDCNPWPVLGSNHIPSQYRTVHFHTNWKNDSCDNVCNEPPHVWEAPLTGPTGVLGRWVDFAMYIKPATAGGQYMDGRIKVWVNGNLVHSRDGNTFYAFNANNRPFYYVKQGYYRERTIVDFNMGGVHVYETPMLVTTPLPAARRP
jgi:hypothetical protein